MSWAATDAATWGLGPNAYRTSLVVVLNDGKTHAQTLSLGAHKATFEEIGTGRSVKVQLALVVDTAEGDYLISDILEQSIDQSLTKPAFSTGWHRIKTSHDADPAKAGHPIDTAPVKAGMLYYIGYNENFGNYKSNDADLKPNPATASLRIGLAHGGENAAARGDVDFDAYVIRITDADGDVVPEGDDATTVKSDYGSVTHTYTPDGASAPIKDTYAKQLVVYGVRNGLGRLFKVDGTIGAGNYALSNVRICGGRRHLPRAAQQRGGAPKHP